MNKEKPERSIYQTVRVNVRQGPGCCQIILWIVGIIGVLALCGVLTQLGA
jgi:hypothetical protein